MQTILRSTRIRIWSVSHSDISPQTTFPLPEMTFQIEYLMAKDEFGIITLNTCQVMSTFDAIINFRTRLLIFFNQKIRS